MPRAIWNGAVLAESEQTEMVEGNHYFPPDSLHREHFRESDHHTVCGWKGTASYYDVIVNDQTNAQAAWYYPDPKPEAAHIKDHVAFGKSVDIAD